MSYTDGVWCKTCPACKGTGEAPKWHPDCPGCDCAGSCETCGGSGEIEAPDEDPAPAPKHSRTPAPRPERKGGRG